MITRQPETKLAALKYIKEKKDLGLSQTDVPFFSSLKSFLESDVAADVEVVSIATPNGYHAQQALEVLDAKKHVIIEKPIALTKQYAAKVILQTLHVQRQVFAVIPHRHYSPSALYTYV